MASTLRYRRGRINGAPLDTSADEAAELSPPPRRAPATGGQWLLIVPIALVLVVFFLFPLTVIFLYSFSSTDELSQLQLTFHNYLGVLTNPTKLHMYLNSVIYSAATALICFVFSFPLAYFVAKLLSRLSQALVIALLVAPLFMSMLIRIFGWRLFFLKYGLMNEFFAWLGLPRADGLTYMGPMAIFGMVYLYFPFMLFPIFVAVSNIPDEVVHAARDLGGGALRIMRQIILPLALPGVAIGAALTFSLSFGDATSSEILVGDNVQLVGNMQKFSFGYAQDWVTGSAEAMIMMLFLLAVIVPVLRGAQIEHLLQGGIE